ncbi:CalY family protein [Brachybacterium kimchii]|uniref:CalY family protein n=1 Tax=Brachybacterium kimchii TaxID=2942909 RepID=A0ABY4N0L1_9MICO|nr:CalY family protein [Brachybacterium kimchii]UQN28078.1 CalY family protein [Brachybacterium kimchii]
MASSSRTVRFMKWGSIPAGLVLSSLLIWHASYAAFSDTTENPGNSWQAGQVEITDDDAGTAMFDAKELAPGDTGTNDIVTTYSGTLDAATRLYGEDEATTQDLAQYIDLKIVAGSGADASTVYTGTLADFAADHSDFASGIDLGRAEGGSDASTPYTFTYTLSADAPDSAQGGTARIGFTWEAQSVSK